MSLTAPPSPSDTIENADMNQVGGNSSFAMSGCDQYNYSVDHFLLTQSVVSMQGMRRWTLDLCLSISIVALTVSLVVYSIVHELRTPPGKCLMGLITSELFLNVSLLIGIFLQHHSYVGSVVCVFVAVIIHYFFLTIILWVNVIAIDLLWKFRNPRRQSHYFVQYVWLVYLVPVLTVSMALALDLTPVSCDSPWHAYRPRYGVRFCTISSVHAMFAFLTAPLTVSFAINIIIFGLAIYKFRMISKEISSIHIHSCIRKRLFIYAKLSILLGVFFLAALFGILTNENAELNYYSALFSCLHGLFIFVAFICKPKVRQLLMAHVHSCKCKPFTLALTR